MTAGHHALGPGGEFDLLRAIFNRLGPAAGPLGDDCALIDVGGTTLALSIDASLEDLHFRTDWLSHEDIGWRATAAALSDLAAVGATPVGVLVSLGVPGNGQRETGNAVELMSGVASCAGAFGAKVLGGDLLRSEKYLVDVAVIGTVERAITRGGARAGDGVWVTGALGAGATALRALMEGRPLAADLRRRFARPEPRIAAGRWLAASGATAMIDVSDGLAADAGHVAAASAVGLEIAVERVPCWAGVDAGTAAASGEEYELLVTLPPAFSEEAARALRDAAGVSLTRIGECVRGAGVRLADRGRAVDVPPGWDHFAR